MQVQVAVAQIPVTWDVGQNLDAITASLAGCRPGEVVVFPEACQGPGAEESGRKSGGRVFQRSLD